MSIPRPGYQAPSSSADNYRVGRRIRVPEVRVIGADGGQVGIIPTHEAMRLAEEAGLELVEVNPRAVPPVCKIMDFGKFKYETSKKEKESRKHQSTIVLKEIKLRPKTDEHDLDFKVKHIRRFLSEGNKCKLVVVFRGREIVHPETGQAMLDSVIRLSQDIAMIEQKAMMEGRRMVMVIGPRVGVVKPAAHPAATVTSPAPRPVLGSAATSSAGSAAPGAASPSASAPGAASPSAASPGASSPGASSSGPVPGVASPGSAAPSVGAAATPGPTSAPAAPAVIKAPSSVPATSAPKSAAPVAKTS